MVLVGCMVTGLGLVRPDPVLQPLSTQSDRTYVEAIITVGHREPTARPTWSRSEPWLANQQGQRPPASFRAVGPVRGSRPGPFQVEVNDQALFRSKQISVTVRRPRPKVYCTLVLGSGLPRNRRSVARALPTPELAPGPARSRSSRPDLAEAVQIRPCRPCGSTSSKLARRPRWPLARSKIDSE